MVDSTRGAASNWKRDCQAHVENSGYELGRSSRNLFHNKIHGYNFMITKTKRSLLELKKYLESVYPIKREHYRRRFDKEHQGAELENTFGRDRDVVSTQSPATLTLSLRVWSSRMGTQCKLQQLTMWKTRIVWLDPEQSSKYRSHGARCLFLSQDRADITFAVNELCQRMSDPSQRNTSSIDMKHIDVAQGDAMELDAMELWVSKSEQAEKRSPAQQRQPPFGDEEIQAR